MQISSPVASAFVLFGALALLASSSGCGTISCLAEVSPETTPDKSKPKAPLDPIAPLAIYGGVRWDWRRFSQQDSCLYALIIPPLLVLGAADLVLSAVTDTLLLPVTVTATLTAPPPPPSKDEKERPRS